jgi:PhoPQ-activated pathogenicity-related protein
MKSLVRGLAVCLAAAMLVAVPAAAQRPTVPLAQQTALDRYIAKKDPVYGWKLVNTIPGPGYKTFVLELTSQSWRSPSEVDKPVWKHWLTVIKPDTVSSNKALLFIGASTNTNPAPTKVNDRSLQFALDTNSVVADLTQVPNQPLIFSDLPGAKRGEDDLIAYSRVKNIETGDDEWLVRLAMVKSGVRALDAVQEFMASPAGGGTKIDQFVVAGASKRGWVTWLVGATDPRVVGIMPMVIDALNSEVITRRHFEMLGLFSDSLGDYVQHGLFPHAIGTPGYRHVMAIEDPYNYFKRDRLKIPKFVVNATGDQYFLPDNSQFYWSAMQEEKRLRYVPNTKHDLAMSDANESMIAFYDSILKGTKRPAYSWTKGKDGSITVTSKDKPSQVLLWQATNPTARDFRVDIIGRAYTSSVLQPQANGTYVARLTAPAKGYTAFFIELHYPSGGKHPFKFTSEVSVLPNTVPYKWEDAFKKYPKRTGPGPAPPRP